MSKPLALDLFCCSGGATRGLQRAGFRVIGVDKVKRPNYCGDMFEQADALAYLRRYSLARYPIKLINAGPPCQKDSALTVGTNVSNGWGHQADKTQIIPELRELLDATGIPYIIEQPVGKAPIRRDLKLCMDMFKQGRTPPYVWRHRWFELGGWSATAPQYTCTQRRGGRVRGWRHGERFEGDYVAVYGKGGGKATVAEAQHALGIDWTDEWEELTEAIPPAYYEWLGREFLKGAGR